MCHIKTENNHLTIQCRNTKKKNELKKAVSDMTLALGLNHDFPVL